MIIGLRRQADGTVAIWGESAGSDRTHLHNEVPKGGSLCGLPYDELIQYAWIETNDAGEFVGGGKYPPADPDQVIAIPDFLRRSP